MNKKTIKNLILGIYTATLFATALVGVVFCAYAALIFIPALLPMLIIAIKALNKTLKQNKLNIA